MIIDHREQNREVRIKFKMIGMQDDLDVIIDSVLEDLETILATREIPNIKIKIEVE